MSNNQITIVIDETTLRDLLLARTAAERISKESLFYDISSRRNATKGVAAINTILDAGVNSLAQLEVTNAENAVRSRLGLEVKPNVLVFAPVPNKYNGTWQDVESDMMNAIAYDYNTHELRVEFKHSNRVYSYMNVSQFEFTQFRDAFSKGAYFNNKIKGHSKYNATSVPASNGYTARYAPRP